MNTDNLIKIHEIDDLSEKEIYSLYQRYVNPGMLKYYDLLGFSRIRPVKSEGMYIYTKDGRTILDFTGGRGVLNHGHNHPRITRIRREFENGNILVVWKDFLSPYVAALAKNLATICPGDLNYSFFCNSGAEANEGALKIAEKFQGKGKHLIIAASNSYHGKTLATLSVSGLDRSRKFFRSLKECLFVPYGDYHTLRDTVLSRCINGTDKNDICAVILESIHGAGVEIPPKGYLKKVRKLTEEYNIILILDEVLTGFGRTGKLFAFEHEDIVPDVVTMSKSFGGGKATIAAYIVRDHIFQEAYGSVQDSLIHTSTFNGFGIECVTAIEAINTLFEENLIDNAQEMGGYLLSELNKLKNDYLDIINDVRGIGLICGIEFRPPSPRIKNLLTRNNISKAAMLDRLTCGLAIRELLSRHNILTYSSLNRSNFLLLTPSLIVKKEEIDMVIGALRTVLSKGLVKLGLSLVKSQFSEKFHAGSKIQ